MLGILLIDKPLGITSHDVVNRLRRRLGTRRVGHAGTLDPLGAGLLVVAIGPATRFLQYLPLEPKVYEAEITFGRVSTTQDAEGELSDSRPVPHDLEALLAEAIPSFAGLVDQIPPMFSAVKVAGKALYAYARKGVEVERESRTVRIDSIEVLSVDLPRVRVRVVCSGGTYLRTLAHDLGGSIGCGAYLSALVRTACGKFDLSNAVPLDSACHGDLMPLAKALPPMPLVRLNEAQTEAIRQGRQVGVERSYGVRLVGLQDPQGEVFGIARTVGNALQPECVIPLEAAHGQV